MGQDGQFEFQWYCLGQLYGSLGSRRGARADNIGHSRCGTNVANVGDSYSRHEEISGKITVRGNVPVPRVIFTLANEPAPPTANAPINITIVQGVVISNAGSVQPVPCERRNGWQSLKSHTARRRTCDLDPAQFAFHPDYSVDSFTYGTTDLLKNPMRVALSDTAEIAIAVDATTVKPHNITGKVTGLLTTQGVRVVMQGGNLGTGVESPVSPDGSFTFTDILPGNYSARLSLSGHVVSDIRQRGKQRCDKPCNQLSKTVFDRCTRAGRRRLGKSAESFPPITS